MAVTRQTKRFKQVSHSFMNLGLDIKSTKIEKKKNIYGELL